MLYMRTNKTQFKFLPKSQGKKYFRFVDICAGIGGMRIAFENLGGKCVFSSEIDKFCQKTYFENFGEIPNGDITKIPINQIPKHDVLLAGFPCQPFSKGGYATRRKLGFKNGFRDEEQGKIFFRLAKIISKKKPKVVLFENVPKLKFHDGGKTLEIILGKLKRLGYSTSYKVINSSGLVPQKRQRLYIVAVLNCAQFDFPEMLNLNPKLEYILEKKYDKKYILSNNLWKWLQKHAKKHRKKGNGFGFRMAHPKKIACTLSARYYKDGSEILIPRGNGNPRKLTPRECARLMGFPDQFKIKVSDKQAYKQFGNSVVIPAVYLVGNKLLNDVYPKKKLKHTYSFLITPTSR